MVNAVASVESKLHAFFIAAHNFADTNEAGWHRYIHTGRRALATSWAGMHACVESNTSDVYLLCFNTPFVFLTQNTNNLLNKNMFTRDTKNLTVRASD